MAAQDPGESSLVPVERIVGEEHADARLDGYLASQFTNYSRVKLRQAINAGGVQVDGKRTKASYRLRAGQTVSIVLPEIAAEGPEPEDIPLDVLFEDDHLIVVNKSPEMVVHPAKGHWSGTLTSALAFRFGQLSSVGGPTRPGIVHRLDRETSGVIVVAKTDQAHLGLAAQFEARTTEKEYTAIVIGTLDRDRDVIEQPIGVHPYHREKMAIRPDHETTRDAKTFYEVIERFRGFALVKVLPKTGRTHQIRVHMAHAGAPVLCDRLYGGRSQITLGEITGDEETDVLLTRHALHARRLELTHPITNECVEFVAPLRDDMETLLATLRNYRSL
ncbi:MAG: RluA family pseudouridine synthase [Planctomycetales bacterium]|nr:RluA family pseudouridine synthase [Planctomycetales bacterium]